MMTGAAWVVRGPPAGPSPACTRQAALSTTAKLRMTRRMSRNAAIRDAVQHEFNESTTEVASDEGVATGLDFEYTAVAFKRPGRKQAGGRSQHSVSSFEEVRGAAGPAMMSLIEGLQREDDYEEEEDVQPAFVVELELPPAWFAPKKSKARVSARRTVERAVKAHVSTRSHRRAMGHARPKHGHASPATQAHVPVAAGAVRSHAPLHSAFQLQPHAHARALQPVVVCATQQPDAQPMTQRSVIDARVLGAPGPSPQPAHNQPATPLQQTQLHDGVPGASTSQPQARLQAQPRTRRRGASAAGFQSAHGSAPDSLAPSNRTLSTQHSTQQPQGPLLKPQGPLLKPQVPQGPQQSHEQPQHSSQRHSRRANQQQEQLQRRQQSPSQQPPSQQPPSQQQQQHALSLPDEALDSLAADVQLYLRDCARKLGMQPRTLTKAADLRGALLRVGCVTTVAARAAHLAALLQLTNLKDVHSLLVSYPATLLHTEQDMDSKASTAAALLYGVPPEQQPAHGRAAAALLRRAPELLTARQPVDKCLIALARVLTPLVGMEGVKAVVHACPGLLAHDAALPHGDLYAASLSSLSNATGLDLPTVARSLVLEEPSLLVRPKGALEASCRSIQSHFNLSDGQLGEVLCARPLLLLESPGNLKASCVRLQRALQRSKVWAPGLTWLAEHPRALARALSFDSSRLDRLDYLVATHRDVGLGWRQALAMAPPDWLEMYPGFKPWWAQRGR